MAAPGQSLPHRAVSSIRGGGGASLASINTSGTGSSSSADNPRTPHRALPSLPSAYSSSPSSLRAEDEVLIIEFGSRKLRVGFAGDAVPKGVVGFEPEGARRVGDFRMWEVGYVEDWRKKGWGDEHELWKGDIRGLDLGLVGDRLERGLREAFNKYLLIDSRPRKVVAVLPSGVPVPLLATALNTLFNRFHTPSVSLMASPVACAVAAGVRSALVVDIGWAETTVTAVYEYREVQSSRSIRAGRLLVENTHKLLASALGGEQSVSTETDSDKRVEHIASFEECEEVATRLVWCKHAGGASSPDQQAEGLPTVKEQDESEASIPSAARPSTSASIPLRSTAPPTTLEMTYDQLSIPAETTFFDSQHPPCFFDDNELPLPLLIYRSLLKLPQDVRGMCMSRIIFTGGCTSVLGLRGRVFDEVDQLIQIHGWDPVRGKGVEAFKTNSKLRRGSRQGNDGPTSVSPSPQQEGGGGGIKGHEQDGVWVDAPSDTQNEVDPVEEQLRKRKGEKPGVHGQLRAIESLGAWSGASLLNLLKVPALATVERDTWREQGINGASRPSEVDQKVAQRQSIGAGGLLKNANANWTLGVWGFL
ncbi:unnamed protein product [Discula destructiva]